MADIDDDIARIAALRGRSAADYGEARRRFIPVPSLELLLHMGKDPVADLQSLDLMPTASRALLTTWERPINAMVWLSLLDQYDDEDFLIRTFRAWYAQTTGHDGASPVRKPRRRLS